MVAALGFGSSMVGKTILPKIASSNRSVQQIENYIAPQLAYMNSKRKRRSFIMYAIPPSSSVFDSDSPAQTIIQFYTAINEKNMKQLDKLIAEDCFFQDYTFPKPLQGKKEVLNFLEQLTMCMGEDQNMQFNVEHICQGNDNTAAVNWHLEWKKIEVPFTKGCSYYWLSVNGNKLVIEKAQVLVESPIKLGVVAMTIFKIMSSLFDAFPTATEWFLKSPHVMFHLLLKAYNIAIRPVISPFLAWYIKLLKFAALILSFSLKLLQYIAKMMQK